MRLVKEKLFITAEKVVFHTKIKIFKQTMNKNTHSLSPFHGYFFSEFFNTLWPKQLLFFIIGSVVYFLDLSKEGKFSALERVVLHKWY